MWCSWQSYRQQVPSFSLSESPLARQHIRNRGVWWLAGVLSVAHLETRCTQWSYRAIQRTCCSCGFDLPSDGLNRSCRTWVTFWCSSLASRPHFLLSLDRLRLTYGLHSALLMDSISAASPCLQTTTLGYWTELHFISNLVTEHGLSSHLLKSSLFYLHVIFDTLMILYVGILILTRRARKLSGLPQGQGGKPKMLKLIKLSNHYLVKISSICYLYILSSY